MASLLPVQLTCSGIWSSLNVNCGRGGGSALVIFPQITGMSDNGLICARMGRTLSVSGTQARVLQTKGCGRRCETLEHRPPDRTPSHLGHGAGGDDERIAALHRLVHQARPRHQDVAHHHLTLAGAVPLELLRTLQRGSSEMAGTKIDELRQFMCSAKAQL